MIYNQSAEILQEELPRFTLYVVKSPGVVSKKMKVGRPSEVGMFSNVNEWDIEE